MIRIKTTKHNRRNLTVMLMSDVSVTFDENGIGELEDESVLEELMKRDATIFLEDGSDPRSDATGTEDELEEKSEEDTTVEPDGVAGDKDPLDKDPTGEGPGTEHPTDLADAVNEGDENDDKQNASIEDHGPTDFTGENEESVEMVDYTVTAEDVANNPDAGLTEGEVVQRLAIPVNEEGNELEELDLETLKVSDLQGLCEGADLPKEDWKDLKKADLIAYIELAQDEQK